MAGEHAGHRQRMRERYLKQGLNGFAPHEVLELILFYAIPRQNVNPLAHRLMEHFGSLHGVLDAPVEELAKVEGVGQSAAVLLSLFSKVARELELSRETDMEVVDNRIKAEEHCRRLLAGLKQEHLYAVCLNGQMQLISDVLIAKGTLSEVPAYPRLVAEAVLRHNAHVVVLCHNHPGGQLSPSQTDIESTYALAHLLAGLGVTLADHLIVCGNRVLSMSSAGFFDRVMPGQEVPQAASSAGQVRIPHQMGKKRKPKE
ncbi:MAG: DNA repair protein RadC [Clostridia bacterium]|nr:DNA repair protein RadC [Clostridia bacterium]